MSNLDKLRNAGVAHPTHDFSDDEKATIESLTDDEVNALVSVRSKVGDLAKKKADDDTHPDTMIL